VLNRVIFPLQYDPTVEESYQTTMDIDGKALQVEILDTAGQDEYTPLRETFMHTGDGFLLVYSIVDDQTLEELKAIREQILRVHRDRKVPMVVIGNKADMAKKDRAVSKEEGKALADEFGAAFLEVSVSLNMNLFVFDLVVFFRRKRILALRNHLKLWLKK
jgi:small GTP-binding protein